MSFGLKKYGVNNTDKRLIKRYVAARWPLDKISNKLSVHEKVVQRVINDQAKDPRNVSVAAAPEGKPASAEVEAGTEMAEVEEAEVKIKEPTKAEQKALQKAQAAATGGESSD